jgi:hypothetical protein
MWMPIAICLLGLLIGGYFWRRDVGQRKLLAVLRHCFDCFAISNKMINAGDSSPKAVAVWEACGGMASIYMESIPRSAAVRAASMKRIEDSDLNATLSDSFAQLLSACMDWLASVPPTVQVKTYQQVFGINAERFAQALAKLYEDTNRIAKQDLRDMGLGHLAA